MEGVEQNVHGAASAEGAAAEAGAEACSQLGGWWIICTSSGSVFVANCMVEKTRQQMYSIYNKRNQHDEAHSTEH